MIKDRVIIIVGANGDMGNHFAKAFTAKKARVTLLSRNPTSLAELSTALPPELHHVVVGDATKAEDMVRAFEETTQRFGQVDAIVLTAGGWSPDSIDKSLDIALSDLEKSYRGLVTPAYSGAWQAQLVFRRQGHGAIFNLSSHVVLKPELKGNYTYGPSKTSVHFFIRQLREQYGLRAVNLISEGINTKKNADFLKDDKVNAVQPSTLSDWIIEHFDEKFKEDPYFETKKGAKLD
jgi:NAD(P)-dependent dehydrogenase (short-subunit alcohol dehydrogenase family)